MPRLPDPCAVLMAVSGLMLASCGGGGGASTGSNSTGNTNLPPGGVPTLSYIAPSSTSAGQGVVMTLVGSGFTPTSLVSYDGGTGLQVTFVSTSELTVFVPPSAVPGTGTHAVAVVNQPSTTAGGSSANTTFTVLGADSSTLLNPVITSSTPASLQSGSSGAVLDVQGTNFIASSVVYWNNFPLATTYVSGTHLQAQVPAADLANITGPYIAIDDSLGNGVSVLRSNGLMVPVGFTFTEINQTANDLVWDPVNQLMYLSVPSTDANHPNTIAVLDPQTGSIGKYVATGNNPGRLAIADDSSLLYVSLIGDNTVQRFTLPSVTADIDFPLGNAVRVASAFLAQDLAVAPGAPHSTAIALAVDSDPAQNFGGTAIYDDSTARTDVAPGEDANLLAQYDSLAWGADATTLYAIDRENGDFYTMTVGSSGVSSVSTQAKLLASTIPTEYIDYEPADGMVYTSDGHVIDPSQGKVVGNFLPNAGANLVFDAMAEYQNLNRAYLISETTLGGPVTNYNLEAFNLSTQALVNSTPIPLMTLSCLGANEQRVITRMIPWGNNRLAFLACSKVYLVGGQIVTQ